MAIPNTGSEKVRETKNGNNVEATFDTVERIV